MTPPPIAEPLPAEVALVLDSMPEGLLVADLEGRIVFGNQLASELLGYAPDRLVSMSLEELVPLELRPVYRGSRGRLIKRIQEGPYARLERRLLTADGREFNAQVNLRRVAWGGTSRLLISFRDVTSEQQVEQETLEHLHSIFEYAEEGIFLVRVHEGGRFAYETFNPTTERWTGVTREQARGRSPHQLMPAAEAERLCGWYRRAVERGVPLTYVEEPGDWAGGLIFQTTLVPVRDARGNVRRIIGMARDITDERSLSEAQRVRAEAQEMFRKVFEASPHTIAISGLESGRIIDVNAAYTGTFGHQRADVVGKSAADLNAWVDPAAREVYVETLRTQGHVRHMEASVRNKSGEKLDIVLSAEVVHLNNEPCVVTYAVDETEKRASAEARRVLEAQLRQAQKMEALGTLAGGIAHDFNNILATIVTYCDLSQGELEHPQAVAEYLNEVQRAAERAAQLVRHILMFSRNERQVLQPIQLQPTIHEVVQVLRTRSWQNIKIHTRIAPDAPKVLGDATQLHQVLMNLAVNAAQAVGDAPGLLEIDLGTEDVPTSIPLAVGLLQPGRYVRLSVRDNGAGMTPSTLEQAFEPFFTTKEPGQGSGLGLSVVHGIMRDHRAGLRVTSQQGAGTTFDLYFVPQDEPPDELSVQNPVATLGRGERVLVIGDEAELGTGVSLLLEGAGYCATAFAAPGEALEALKQDPAAFALVITELSMPGLSGVDVLKQLRAHSAVPPVVLMTGFGQHWRREDLLRQGFADVLTKPVSGPILLNSVAQVLGT